LVAQAQASARDGCVVLVVVGVVHERHVDAIRVETSRLSSSERMIPDCE
jgi:hypothetical protein